MSMDLFNSINKKEDTQLYYIVKNFEEQYSIWPSYKPIPEGWETIGDPRKKSSCLEYIKEVWTDMRPLSLRRKMEEIEKKKNCCSINTDLSEKI